MLLDPHSCLSVEWVSGIKLNSDLISFVLVNYHLHLTILLSSDLWIQKCLKCLSSEFSRDRRGNPGTGKWRAGALGAPCWPAALVKVALRWSLGSMHFVGPRRALRWQKGCFPVWVSHLTQREHWWGKLSVGAAVSSLDFSYGCSDPSLCICTAFTLK